MNTEAPCVILDYDLIVAIFPVSQILRQGWV